MPERRHFCRIHFSGPVTLSDPRSGQQWYSQLLDLSLQGALLQTPADWSAPGAPSYRLSYSLPESDQTISMEVEPVHQQGDHLGVHCLAIDLDSASHLKRLVELNLGDDRLLQRELLEMIAEH